MCELKQKTNFFDKETDKTLISKPHVSQTSCVMTFA